LTFGFQETLEESASALEAELTAETDSRGELEARHNAMTSMHMPQLEVCLAAQENRNPKPRF